MRRKTVVLAAVVLTVALGGCGLIESLFNPFTGKWKSGITEIKFTRDGKFELAIGRAVSLNLDGEYTYDEKNLFLSFDGGEPLKLSYEFVDDKSRLVLDPMTDSDFIQTRLKLTKQ
jgi:hypothetical protein